MKRSARISSTLPALFLASVVFAEPTTPEESIARMSVPPGYVVELVAAEPDVQSPVAMAWDEKGRLFVAEMTDYPITRGGGRIRLLEDPDEKGRRRKSTVFAEGIPFPTGVSPFRGGLLVSAAPDLLFLKDEDGDGRADRREPLLTGFAEGNQQLRVNAPLRGLDNWIYLCNGRSGGRVQRPDGRNSHPIELGPHDLRWNPRSGAIELLGTFSQFGQAISDAGDRFVNWNTIPFRHDVVPREVLSRNPFLPSGAGVATLEEPAVGNRVFPLSAPTATFNAEPFGFFNASCGPAVDRGGIFPPADAGSLFVCEPLFNIVHRRRLVPAGPTFRAERPPREASREFLASSDDWFRPVFLASGPDGALYIADFARAMIEHPQFVKEDLRATLPFLRGGDRGRIYRLRPAAAALYPATEFPRSNPEELVALLAHPNGWTRDTAQRLVVDEGRLDAEPAVRKLLSASPVPLGRLHALYVLEGLGKLVEADLLLALRDPAPLVREHAVRLAGNRRGSRRKTDRVVPSLASDDDGRVRFQVAIAAGSIEGAAPTEALARIAARDADDPWTRLSVLASLRGRTAAFLDRWQAASEDLTASPSAGRIELVRQAAECLGAEHPAGEVQAVSRWIGPPPPETFDALRAGALVGLIDGLERGRVAPSSVLPAEQLRHWRTAGRRVATTPDASLADRVLAGQLLARIGEADDAAVFQGWLASDQPIELQRTAIDGLGRRPSDAAADLLVQALASATPAVREAILAVLLRRPAWHSALLDAVASGAVAASDLGPERRIVLLESPDRPARERAARLLPSTGNPDRAKVVAEYLAKLPSSADAGRGAALFERHCAGCHRLRNKGWAVGPDLSGLLRRPREQFVADILDPARQAMPDAIAFAIATTDGQVRSGLIVAESSSSVTIRRAAGVEESLLRSEIESIRSTGKSLMPEGFEQSLTPADLADLIGYLVTPAAP